MPRKRRLARNHVEHIEPQIQGDKVVCSCGSPMTMQEGLRLIDPPERWVWYRCNRNTSHVTAAFPMPVREQPPPPD